MSEGAEATRSTPDITVAGRRTSVEFEWVTSVSQLDRFEAQRLQTSAGAYLSFARLESLERDPRWQSHHLAIRANGTLVGLAPCYALERPPDARPDYSLSQLLPDLPAQRANARWLLVGGRADVACGFPRHESCSADEALELAQVAGSFVRAKALELGRSVAALYVSALEREFVARLAGTALDCHTLGFEGRLPVVGDGEGDYVQQLSQKQRGRVRAEWRARAREGLVTRMTTWRDLMDVVVPLLAEAERKRSRPDHPKLVRARLEAWLENDEIDPVAFEVSRGGEMLAVSLGWRWRRIYQGYAVALTPCEVPVRHLAYVESIIYAPLRYAAEAECVAMTLGLASSEPKRLRGADLVESFALLEAR
jgi:hypothetical protein